MTNDDKLYTSAVNAFKYSNDVRALELFLMIPDYKDSDEYIEEILKDSKLKEKMYQDAVLEYNSHNYRKAMSFFKWIEDYRDSKDYIIEIKEILEPKQKNITNNDKICKKSRRNASGIVVFISTIISFIMTVVICMLLPIEEGYFIVGKSYVGTILLLLSIVILASICFFGILNIFIQLKKKEDSKNKLVSLKNILRVLSIVVIMGLLITIMFTTKTSAEKEFKTVAKNVPAVFSIAYLIIMAILFVSTFYYEISTNEYIYNNFNKKIPKIILILAIVFNVFFNMIQTMIYDEFSLIIGFGLYGMIAYGLYLIVDYVTDELIL